MTANTRLESALEETTQKRNLLRQSPALKYLGALSRIYDVWDVARQEEHPTAMRLASDALYRWSYNCYLEMRTFIDRYQARCHLEEWSHEPELSKLESIRANIAYSLERFTKRCSSYYEPKT